jgi:hypothetical protein
VGEREKTRLDSTHSFCSEDVELDMDVENTGSCAQDEAGHGDKAMRRCKEASGLNDYENIELQTQTFDGRTGSDDRCGDGAEPCLKFVVALWLWIWYEYLPRAVGLYWVCSLVHTYTRRVSTSSYHSAPIAWSPSISTPHAGPARPSLS